jgi:hypothetical protein
MRRGAALLAAPTILFLSAFDAKNGADQPISPRANTSIGMDKVRVTASTGAASMASKPKKGLEFSLGPTGLVSLRYNDQELIFKPGGLELSNKPKFKEGDGTIFRPSDEATVVAEGDNVTQTFSWGASKRAFPPIPRV